MMAQSTDGTKNRWHKVVMTQRGLRSLTRLLTLQVSCLAPHFCRCHSAPTLRCAGSVQLPNTCPISTLLCASTVKCQHYLMPAPPCASTVECQHYLMPTLPGAETACCRHCLIAIAEADGAEAEAEAEAKAEYGGGFGEYLAGEEVAAPLCANTTLCQHYVVPTLRCANTTLCQHYFTPTLSFVPAPLCANTTLCQHYIVPTRLYMPTLLHANTFFGPAPLGASATLCHHCLFASTAFCQHLDRANPTLRRLFRSRQVPTLLGRCQHYPR